MQTATIILVVILCAKYVENVGQGAGQSVQGRIQNLHEL